MSPLTARLDTPIAPGAIAALVYLAFLLLRLAPYGFDPSVLVVAGERVVDRTAAPPNLFVLPDSWGYDGEFYYRFALDPCSNRPTDHGIRLADPAYYQQRILYPLLARLASGGDPARIPAALVAVNYAGLCVLGLLGGLFARRAGRHALWGLTLVLAPPFVFSLARDLTEITEAVFLLASLLALRAERHVVASVLLSLAALARPSALLVAGGLALAGYRLERAAPRRIGAARSAALQAVPRSDRGRAPWVWLVPFCVAAAWRLWLEWHWGESPVQVVRNAFAPPLVDLASAWWRAAGMRDRLQVVQFLEHCALGVFVVSVAWTCRLRRGAAHERLGWYLAVMMVSVLSQAVWISDWGFVRVLVECYVLGVAILLSARTRLGDLTLCAGLVWWAATVVEVLWWRPI